MKSIICLLVVFGCISVAKSLQCYRCDSQTKSECGDPFKKSEFTDSIDTVGEGGACLKTKASGGGQTAVGRSGLESIGLLACLGGVNDCKTMNVEGGSLTTCCCTSNLCNGASYMIGQQTFVLFSIVSVVVMIANRWY